MNTEIETVQARPSVVRRAALAVGVAAPVVLLGGNAFAAGTTPDPATLAGTLADSAGGSMLDAVVAVLPVLVPFLTALWAIGFVWKKIGLGKAKAPR